MENAWRGVERLLWLTGDAEEKMLAAACEVDCEEPVLDRPFVTPLGHRHNIRRSHGQVALELFISLFGWYL